MKLKAISFVTKGDLAKGYFFYESPYNTDYGNIVAINGLTLPKALAVMKEKNIDAIKDFQTTISIFPLTF